MPFLARALGADRATLWLIDGATGAGKTEIIRRLDGHGVQAIDLEGLTAHKGSVFGADPATPQPTQRQFESLLFDALRRCDPARPIAVEAESSRIGRLVLPRRLWKSMLAAPRLIIRADAQGAWSALAEALMRSHYDPLYERPRARSAQRVIGEVTVDALDADGFDRAAAEAARLIAH